MRVTPAAIVLVIALFAAGCEANRKSEPRARSTGTGSQLEIGDVQAFVPRTQTEGAKVVMPVTFPDGSTAEVVYPRGLDIAELGAQPYSSGGLTDCCESDFFVLYDAVPKGELSGDAPLEIYRETTGAPVEYWRVGAQGHDPDVDRWLIFSFGPWKVLVHDRKGSMTRDQLSAWARLLRGEKSSDGFLRLSADAPLRLAKAGEHAGPELLFSNRRKIIRFFVGECQPHPTEDGKLHGLGGESGPKTDWAGGRCFADQTMRMNVQTGYKQFARQVMDRVEVRNVQLAS